MTVGPINTPADAAAALENANNAGNTDFGQQQQQQAPPVNQQQQQSQFQNQQQPQQQSSGNPAWQGILDKVPAVLHDQLRPALEEWDKGVNERFSKVHSQYAAYKPFMDAGVQPDQLQQAHQIWNMLNNDPRALYEQLGQFLGQQQQPQQQGGQGLPYQQQQQQPSNQQPFDMGEFGDPQQVDITQHPQFQALAQQQQALVQQQQQFMQQMQAAQQAEMSRQAESWVEQQQTSIMNDLNAKYGLGLTTDKTDQNSAKAWDYILQTAAVIGQRTNNYDEAMKQAADQYVGLINAVRSNPGPSANAPMVIPPSNGMPSQTPPGPMTGEQKRAYGAQLLSAALREQ